MKNKVLITGVSRGIGKAICKRLAKEGYEIYGTYNSSEKEALDLKKELNIEIYKVDFSDRNSTKKFLTKIKKENFYAIINNAGMIEFETWDEFSMQAWDKTMEVNLNTPMLISHTLRNNILNNGVIINISSTDGLIGSFSSIAYSVSKAALLNLTKCLTNVFSDKKIRVNSITPGWVGSGMDTPAMKDAKWMNPLNRTATYEEVADLANFLLSNQATFINGESIVIDGGSSAVDYVLKKESEAIV